jgi:uncharacterized protein HemX
MNPDNQNTQENEQLTAETESTEATVQTPPKRTYSKRESKTQTIASLNKQIEAKMQQIDKIQAEIENLTAKRNDLYFGESEMLGLIDLMADPDKARWLAEKLEEYKHKRN